MFGLLNIDKPAGVTSRDVVNRVQRLVKPHKTGHAGTLDPLATGVLVVAVGPATRLVEYVQRMPKTYAASFLLGRSSDTEDVSGQVVELQDAALPTLADLQAALPRFVGEIQQEPPAFSALKVAGRRAYALARQGTAVQLAARPVRIYGIEMVRYEYPELELRVRCGSGTYIRSLGRDIARALGTEAAMAALRREAIGVFEAAQAVRYDELSLAVIEERLLSAEIAVGDLPQVVTNAAEARRLALGQSVADRWNIAGSEAAALDEAGKLVAIVELRGGQRWPTKGFVQP